MMLAATVAAAAHGQDYPTRPIKMLVPAAPGGIGDILPRIFGQKLAESGSHTVVVENRTAGAGVVATEAIAKAPPDGYTLLVGNQGLLSIRPQLTKVPYDPVKDFAPIVLLVSVPNILVVHPSVPAQVAAGAARLRQGEPRQADLFVAGHRRLRPYRRRTAQARRRRRHHPRAVSWRRSRARRRWPPGMST